MKPGKGPRHAVEKAVRVPRNADCFGKRSGSSPNQHVWQTCLASGNPADWKTYRCRWCNEQFRRTARTGRKPKFCGDSCRMAFWGNVRWTTRNGFRRGPARVAAQSNETPPKTLVVS